MADGEAGVEAGGKFVMQKIGPLPLVAWVGIGAGAIAIVIALRSKNKPATQTATGQAGTVDLLGVSGLNSQVISDTALITQQQHESEKRLADLMAAQEFGANQVAWASGEQNTDPEDAQKRLASAYDVWTRAIDAEEQSLSAFQDISTNTGELHHQIGEFPARGSSIKPVGPIDQLPPTAQPVPLATAMA